MEPDPAGRPQLSFVLPACNEVSNIEAMAERIHTVAGATGMDYEMVWVNDGSTDGTESLLECMAAADPRIRTIHFSRHFGQMAALTAGLEAARASDVVVCLDADGQHPPELVPEMLAQWRAGADIVQGLRRRTASESLVKRSTSRLFYRLLNALSGLDLPAGATEFRLLDRQVVDALNSLPERVRFVRGLVHWVGFRRAYLEFEAPARLSGCTKYGLPDMTRLALSGVTSFSFRPLRLALILGLLVIAAAAVYAVFILYCFVCGIPLATGWTSTILVVLILGGVQLLLLGIESEYLARLYFEQKHRPLYIVRKPRAGSGDDAR